MENKGHKARRFWILRFLMVVAGVILVARIVHIQVFEHEKYRAKALSQWERPIPIKAERGNLYDRHGQPLALSVTTYRVGVSGSRVKEAGPLAVLLAEVLEGDRARIKKSLARAGKSHVVLASDVVLTADQQTRLKAEGQGAVTLEPLHARLYPSDGVGASIIGRYRPGGDKSSRKRGG